MYLHVVAFQNFSLLINIAFFNTSNNSDFDRNVDHKLWPTTAIGLYLTFCSDTCVKILPELEASIQQRDNEWVCSLCYAPRDSGWSGLHVKVIFFVKFAEYY